jgi:hypothetical protein
MHLGEAGTDCCLGPKPDHIGYYDENGSARCVPCASKNPAENWTQEERIFPKDLAEFEATIHCGLCGEAIAPPEERHDR